MKTNIFDFLNSIVGREIEREHDTGFGMLGKIVGVALVVAALTLMFGFHEVKQLIYHAIEYVRSR